MSKSHTIAEAMAARLNAQLQLAGVTAIAARQKELGNEINQRVLKAGGAAIIIQFEGFSNPASNASGNVTVTRRYTASIYTRPILRDGETPADDVVEFVAKTLHDWEMDEYKTSAADIRVLDCEVVPDRSFLIYQLDIECLSRL
jgi:hypothetical protein